MRGWQNTTFQPEQTPVQLARGVATLVALGLVALAGAFSINPATAQETRSMTRTLTVSASGIAEAEPDRARVSSGVTTLAETARAALDANSSTMKDLIGGLKDAGIAAADIQTSHLNISPRYDNSNRQNREPRVIGYQVNNEVSVLIRDLDQLGQVLDRMVSLGANQMRGLSFEVSKAETLRDAARQDAVKNARRRAELYAAAAGSNVGKVLHISEGGSHGGPERPQYARQAMAMDAVPVERGTQTLSANVTVTWEIVD